MQPHFFISDCDGALYDTRVPNWSSLPPLRPNYRRHAQAITNAAELKAALRAGAYAWPGGYPLYFVLQDGEALSFGAAKQNVRNILDALANPMRGNDWQVVALEINWEDADLRCAHTNERIPSAYGEG